MSKTLQYGLAGAAAVVAVAGFQLISALSGGPSGSSHLLLETDSGVPITITMPPSGWYGEPNGGVLCWGDPAEPCAGPPDGAGIFAFASREYRVYGDACYWSPPPSYTTATTVDELVDALANQRKRLVSPLAVPPEDLTVDGYAGKKIRLVMGAFKGDVYGIPIKDICDEGTFALFGLPGEDPARYSEGPGQIEEVWALDVDGVVVVLDGVYYADTPQNALDELHAILRSATLDPATATPQPTPVRVAPGVGKPLGWSRDGTRVLVQEGNETLFILHADGSETKVADISKFNDPGSARPAGATISPDGSRVVFAGLTTTSHLSCHDGALFAVAADGGPAEVLWESQVPQNGIVRYPTFSPNGTQIAFADGYCDSDHSVWVMNADGSDARQIVSGEILSAGHVYGLAWSPAGDRLALDFEGATYTFATDGSEFTQVSASSASEYCWPGQQC